MSEWRTQGQIDADEVLQRAIENNLNAYAEAAGVPSVLEGRAVGEYVLVVSLPGVSDEKAQTTAYEYMLANGSIPWHSISGLLRWAQIELEAKMVAVDE